ncbi:LCCL domain-containing protein [Picosynechococcus sp. PCC 7117]|uniref:LCCL domain-containing protein n=1 Tax=Picosynechococcus sp. PCC 7117 TaxID=195498 RepID=UPI000810BCA3|nr:LCCL domain-containing protein [Picosynechococcus sp. PCC 7117]ANV86973.1 hypothetical protein AWQ22_05555 [Picosynechococcus sp. PCC 7117]
MMQSTTYFFGAIALTFSLGACTQNNTTPESNATGGGTVATPESAPETPASPPTLQFTTLEWEASPVSLEIQDQVGQIFEFSCPPGDPNQRIWGTGVYTSDSSICAAAVHAGLFAAETGGNLALEILAGQDLYTGSQQNAVTSRDYGAWDGSFRFPEASGNAATTPNIQWDSTPGSFGIAENVGDRYSFNCPPNGELGASVWGTDIYTNDSAICVAAVHAGEIDLATGGPITIEIAPGQDSYTGGDRNGVVTADYGSWGGSFIFLDE